MPQPLRSLISFTLVLKSHWFQLDFHRIGARIMLGVGVAVENKADTSPALVEHINYSDSWGKETLIF